MKTQITSQSILTELLNLSFNRTSELCFTCFVFNILSIPLMWNWSKDHEIYGFRKILAHFLGHVRVLWQKVKSGEMTFTRWYKIPLAELKARAPHSDCLSCNHLYILFRRQDFRSLYTLGALLLNLWAKHTPLWTMWWQLRFHLPCFLINAKHASVT